MYVELFKEFFANISDAGDISEEVRDSRDEKKKQHAVILLVSVYFLTLLRWSTLSQIN
jgi:hypothetical protein